MTICNYSETAKHYDTTRQPVGLEIILDFLQTRLSAPLKELRVLDAGCGTGNYLEGLYSREVFAYGIEQNPRMLAIAKAKIAPEYRDRLTDGDLVSLNVSPGSFDAVIVNMVLHHLTDLKCSENPNTHIETAIQSFANGLSSEGLLIVSTSTAEQIRKGFWWAALIPNAVSKVLERFPSIEVLDEIAIHAGFRKYDQVAVLHQCLQRDSSIDYGNPLNNAYLDGDSTWALCTPEEIEQARQTLEKQASSSSMEVVVKDLLQKARKYGQATFLVYQKHS